VQQRTDLTAVPHLTCVDASADDLRAIATRYWDLGVRHIVALRGDFSEDMKAHKKPQSYAVDLVKLLREVNDFDISVAAYPEVHPEAPSADFDLNNFAKKVDAGASRGITQFFYNNEAFLRFRDSAAARGIQADVVPGILPVTNYKKLQRFTEFANVTDNDPLLSKLLGINIALEQIKVLADQGVNHFHFYTLNRADLTYSICHYLGARADCSKNKTAA